MEMGNKLPVPGRLTIWMTVGQEPIVLAVSEGGGCLDIFPRLSFISSSSQSLRDRLTYCLKGPLKLKQPNQPYFDYIPSSLSQAGPHSAIGRAPDS